MKKINVCSVLGEVISGAGENMRKEGALAGNYFGYLDVLIVREGEAVSVSETVAKLERFSRFCDRKKLTTLRNKIKRDPKRLVDENQLIQAIFATV